MCYIDLWMEGNRLNVYKLSKSVGMLDMLNVKWTNNITVELPLPDIGVLGSYLECMYL